MAAAAAKSLQSYLTLDPRFMGPKAHTSIIWIANFKRGKSTIKLEIKAQVQRLGRNLSKWGLEVQIH